MKKLIFLIILVCWIGSVHGQKTHTILATLDSLANTSIPQLNNDVDISFGNISIKELIRTLGNSTGLNITIDPGVSYSISSNFNNVRAAEVIGYLCNQYNLELTVQGTILHLQPVVATDEKLTIDFPRDSTISYEVRKIKSTVFFKELTDKTGYNFILSPEVENSTISCYARGINFNDAIFQIATENKLEIQKKSDKFYAVSAALDTSSAYILKKLHGTKPKKFSLDYKNALVSSEIESQPVPDVLSELSRQSGYSVCLLSPVEKEVSIECRNASLSDFLNNLFFGTENTYRITDNTIFVGERKLPGIKSCEQIKLNNRSVDSLLHMLPEQMTKDLNIKEFSEQNSFVVWGDADIISNFRRNVEKIDVVVPVILIDVMIIDAGKNFEIESGIEAGLSDTPTPTAGTINPGLDFTMGAPSVNNLLGRVGLTNLGKVSPNFYLKLKAMETNGILEIRSTPQLSTMNGHSAIMSVGQTEYYREETSNIYGSLSTQIQTQKIYKPVEAKLSVSIRPFVTGNGEVSLNINVEQSKFTSRIDEFAPPGLESRKFSSMIRVRNQEMVLLGGLEEDTNSSNRSGWPLLSRIPVLNWIFSHKSDKKNKSHLNIFIKPTVIY